MSLAIAGVIGYFGRSTPISLETCKSIEAVRAEVLRRRGFCPSEPRLLIFAAHEAGGLNHEHSYQYAATSLVDAAAEASNAPRQNSGGGGG